MKAVMYQRGGALGAQGAAWLAEAISDPGHRADLSISREIHRGGGEAGPAVTYTCEALGFAVSVTRNTYSVLEATYSGGGNYRYSMETNGLVTVLVIDGDGEPVGFASDSSSFDALFDGLAAEYERRISPRANAISQAMTSDLQARRPGRDLD